MNGVPSNPLLQILSAFFEGRTAGWFFTIVIVPVLMIAALILPPISLPQRFLGTGYTSVPAGKAGSVADADGAQLAVAAGASKSDLSLKLTHLTRDAFMKSSLAQGLGSAFDVKSPLFQPSIQGPTPPLAVLTVPIPDAADPLATLDIYGVTGKKWTKLPFDLYRDKMVIDVYLKGNIPEGVLITQTSLQPPTISADLTSGKSLPPPASGLVRQLNPVGLTIAGNGGIAGSLPTVPELSANSPYQIFPTVGDWVGGQLRSDLVDIMVTTADVRKQHIQALIDLSVEKLYPGLNIDYQGVTPENQGEFSAFVHELAVALHAKDKMLSVTLPAPTAKSAGKWDTGAYDWDAIGREADAVKIPLPMNSDAFTGDPAPVQLYLQWAVGHVDRYKLELIVPMLGRDETGPSYVPISVVDAIKLVGPVSVSDKVAPGGKATFDLPKLHDAGLKYESTTGMFSFGYQDGQGQAHTVWLENADSLAKKIALARQFNLRGVMLHEPSDEVDARAWEALKGFQQAQAPAYTSKPAIVWQVNGDPVGKSPADDPEFEWTATDAGQAKVEAFFSFDDGVGLAGTTDPIVIQVAVGGPTPKATPTKATGMTTSGTPAAAATPGPTKTRAPTSPAAPAVASNFTGKNMFGYGIQVNWNGADREKELSEINQMGFGWAKIQVRWCDFENSKGNAPNLGTIDDFVNRANAHGVKVLFSIVCAPSWSRKDGGAGGAGPPSNMQDAADFISGLAGIYCNKGLGAIEVWNEENLLTEWHGQPLSADSYISMLKAVTPAIRAKCPSVIIISGAPTPTGWNDGVTAIDDVNYLDQLYQKGLKDLVDAVGAHPSGYNVPALCNSLDPNCNRPGASFQAPFTGRHHSWSFLSTMTSYRAVMQKYGDSGKQIWATEFGWPVGTGGTCGSGPCHPAGADNSPSDVATWFPQAYQWAKQQRWVGVMFVWNLDFYGGEVGAFHIEGQPAFTSLAGMAK